jgi:hypothetical protein
VLKISFQNIIRFFFSRGSNQFSLREFDPAIALEGYSFIRTRIIPEVAICIDLKVTRYSGVALLET